MRWSAVSKSVLVHLAGLATALMPSKARFIDAQSRGSVEQRLRTIEAPHISLAGGQVPQRGHTAVSGRVHSSGDLGCPRQRQLDRIAAPDFPIFGDEGPFAGGGKTPRSPAFCVLIGADGRVSALALATTSGERRTDLALRGTILRLAFHPAERRGRAVAAWHRLVVNRGDEWVIHPARFDVVIVPTPESVVSPRSDMPVPTPPAPPFKPPPEASRAKIRIPAQPA
jgi:hypothetical protein